MNHIAFVGSYARLITRAWASDAFFDYLVTHPREAIASEDIVIPSDATIEVTILADARNGRIEHQVALWEAGEFTGRFKLFVPRKPADYQPDNIALSDEQLDGVAAGSEPSVFCSTVG